MGRFPTFEETNPLNSGNPQQIAGTTDARIRGDALSQIGQHMAKMGEAIAGEQALIAANHAKELAAEAQIEADKLAKPDGSDYQQIFQNSYNDRVSALQANLDPLAAKLAAPHFDAIKSDVVSTGLRTGFEMQHSNFKILSAKKTNVMVNNIMNDYTLAPQYLEELRATDKSNRQLGVPPAWLDATYAESSDAIAGARVESMVLRGRQDPKILFKLKEELGASATHEEVLLTPSEQAAFGLLPGDANKINFTYKSGEKMDKGLSDVYRNLNPTVKLKILNHIQKTLEAGTKIKLSVINDTYKALMQKQIDNVGLTPNDVAEGDRVTALSPPEFYERNKAHWNMIRKAEDIVRVSVDEGKFKADAALAALKPSDDAKPLVREQERLDILHINKVLDTMEKKKTHDPMQFALDTDSTYGLNDAYKATKDGLPDSMRNFNTKLLAYQRAHHLPESLMNESGAKSIETQLISSSKLGLEELQTNIAQLKAQYGDDLVSVLSEVGHYNPENSTIALLGIFQGEQSNEVAKNLVEADRIRKDYFTKVDATAHDFKDAFISIQDTVSDYFYGNPEMRNSGAIKAIGKEIELRAKRDVVDNNMSISAAVSKARKSVLSNYETIPAGKLNVFMPKGSGNDVVLTKEFIYRNLPTDNYEFAGKSTNYGYGQQGQQSASDYATQPKTTWEREWDFKNTNLYNDKMDQESIRAAYNDFKNNAQIVTTDDQAGIKLVFNRQGRLRPVLDKEGKPMAVSFEQLSRYNMARGGFYLPTKKPTAKAPIDSYEESAPEGADDIVDSGASVPENLGSVKSQTDAPLSKGMSDNIDAERAAFLRRSNYVAPAEEDQEDSLDDPGAE